MLRRTVPDLLAEYQQFAIPPYPQVFVQIDFEAYLRGRQQPPDSKSDTHVAYFLEDGLWRHVMSFAADDKRGRSPKMLPFVFEDRQPAPPMDARTSRVIEIARQKVSAGIGRDLSPLEFHRMEMGTLPEIDPGAEEEQGCGALDHWSIALAQDFEDEFDDPLATVLVEQRGDVALALAAILLLNRPKNDLVSWEEQPPGFSVIGDRVCEYGTHNTVHLRLDPDRIVRKLKREAVEHARHRRHEVAGHFYHYPKRLKSSCAHEWQEVEERKWRCPKCGLHRVWKEHHLRGDAGLGWVNKHYEVTA